MRQLRLVPRLETNPRPNNPRFMIHVDRSIRPAYPSWVKRALYPDLECAGPTDFDLSKIDRVLNLQDGLAIQKKFKVFRELFGKSIIHLGASCVEDRFGNFHVPRISLVKGKMEMSWFLFNHGLVSELIGGLGVIRCYV